MEKQKDLDNGVPSPSEIEDRFRKWMEQEELFRRWLFKNGGRNFRRLMADEGSEKPSETLEKLREEALYLMMEDLMWNSDLYDDIWDFVGKLVKKLDDLFGKGFEREVDDESFDRITERIGVELAWAVGAYARSLFEEE